MRRCDCCDNPLEHEIRRIVARYEAPIPPPTAANIVTSLKDALADFDDFLACGELGPRSR